MTYAVTFAVDWWRAHWLDIKEIAIAVGYTAAILVVVMVGLFLYFAT